MTSSLEQLAITETETLDEVLECLGENFSIKTQGACDQKTLFEILVRAASNGDTIENTAKTLKKIPSGNDIRYHLNKINDFEDLERQINQALLRVLLGVISSRTSPRTFTHRRDRH